MKTLKEWAGITAFFVALLTLMATSIAVGRRDQKITQLEEQKVDKAELERRLGRMEGDLRVIKCAVRPQVCGSE